MSEEVIRLFNEVNRILKSINERLAETEYRVKELEKTVYGIGMITAKAGDNNG